MLRVKLVLILRLFVLVKLVFSLKVELAIVFLNIDLGQPLHLIEAAGLSVRLDLPEAIGVDHVLRGIALVCYLPDNFVLLICLDGLPSLLTMRRRL